MPDETRLPGPGRPPEPGRLQPAAPLNKELFVKQMPVTAGGPLFIHQPYKIASYAQGGVRVFLPLAEVWPLLRENLPLPGASGVAVR